MQRKLAAGGAAAPGVTVHDGDDQVRRAGHPLHQRDHGRAAATPTTCCRRSARGDLSEHPAVAVDPVAAQLTFNALDPPDARRIDCNRLPPWTGRQASAVVATARASA